MESLNFSDIGRVGAIQLLFRESGFKIKDTSSYICGSGGSVIRTASRMWLEGIDFDLTYFPLKHLGYKCVIGTVGEIYAKLGRAESISVRIGVSSKLDLGQILELWKGICSAAAEHHIDKADLDLMPSVNGLSISISISGQTENKTEEARLKAASKDIICISGNLGAAFLGMSLLEQEKRMFDKSGNLSGKSSLENFKMIVGSYLKPELNPDIISQLKDSDIIPSYGYFVNRGLADAAKRLNRDSGLGVKIYTEKIPFEGNSFDAGKKLNIDPVSAAMNGGDDFRLMFVVPISKYETLRHDFQTFSIIGHLARPEVGTVLVSTEGLEFPIHAQGWKDEDKL